VAGVGRPHEQDPVEREQRARQRHHPDRAELAQRRAQRPELSGHDDEQRERAEAPQRAMRDELDRIDAGEQLPVRRDPTPQPVGDDALKQSLALLRHRRELR